jgi:hypothetical protein
VEDLSRMVYEELDPDYHLILFSFYVALKIFFRVVLGFRF